MKNFVKISIIFLLVFNFCVCSGFALPNGVRDGHWASSYIDRAANDGWIYLKDNYFEPDIPATREHVVYMVIRAWNLAYQNGKTYGNLSGSTSDLTKYVDVHNISFDVLEEFKVAVYEGIIKGYQNHKLKPLGNITRAEMATIMYRIAKVIPDENKIAEFNDEIPLWAREYIDVIVKSGIMEGYETGEFKADSNITYAEVVTMLYRWIYE